MSRSAWQLRDSAARLRHKTLSAGIDLTQPARGLFEIETEHGKIEAARILGVQIPAGGGECPLAESLARGTDLLATYRESAEWPVQVDAAWRTGGAHEPESSCGWVELIVSVRTPSLDSRPELAVDTFLPAREILVAADAEATRFEPHRLSASVKTVFRADDGPAGCLVFRLPGGRLSYAEMIHPADFRCDELSFDPPSMSGVHLRHYLFTLPLEKGVILRARLRGVFLPTAGDLAAAAESYRAFLASEPPLEV